MHTCHKHLFAGAALAYLVWPAGCTAQMMLSAAAASQIIEGCAVHAMEKATAVALWHFSTANMAAAAKETPGFGNAPHVVAVPGGIPVFSAEGKQFAGAVGVSGEAPVDDAACAEAGVKAAGLSSSFRKTDPAR